MDQHFVRRSLSFVLAVAAAVTMACGRESARSADQGPAGTPTPINAASRPVMPAVTTTPVSVMPTAAPAANAASNAVFTGTREETERFIAYYDSIRLTPEQERVKVEALSTIPAPCCSENPLATCCCPCNMAKAAWGLSAWLITGQSYGVEEVRQATKDWLASANPAGFSGDACDNGGCSRPIRENGCGGMNAAQVL